jgi:hypothetical protein
MDRAKMAAIGGFGKISRGSRMQVRNPEGIPLSNPSP